MTKDVGLKIIIVLLAVMVVSLTAALIIMNSEDKDVGNDTTVTEKPSDKDTTASDTESTDTTTPDTTEPDTTESSEPDESTSPSETTPPAQTTPPESTTPPETTEPEETAEPSGPNAPEGFERSKSFRSSTGTSLNVRADVKAFERDGRAYVKVELYLEHYSISIGAKSGQLSLGETTVKFKTSPISQSENVKTSTLLYSYESEIQYGETVSVAAEIDFVSVNYSGKALGVVALDGILVAE